MKKPIAFLLLLIPIGLFSQNIDVDILKAIHNPEPVSYDGFFRFVSDANIYVITGNPVTMSIARLASHDDGAFRNAVKKGHDYLLSGALIGSGYSWLSQWVNKKLNDK